MASNLAAFVRYLEHSHFAIKSIVTGEKGAQEAHFEAISINRADDFISLRNGERQLWVNLQKLKPKVTDYISFRSIESYKNVYIDLDCKKPDKMKDYAATEEERAAALASLPLLRQWLTAHELRCGLGLSTGNGAGMVLPIPETKAEPVFIAKLAAFLKLVQKDIENVDPAMFDPPRVMGIPGTINAKLETEDRKNRMREVVGEIPERIEDQALLDFINSMVPDQDALKKWVKLYDEPQANKQIRQTPPGGKDATINIAATMAKLNRLLALHVSLKEKLGGNGPEKDRSKAEYQVCGSLINAGFTDPEIDHIMQNVSKIGKWQEEGDHYRFEQTLEKLRTSEAAKADEQKPCGPTVLTAFQKLVDNEGKIKGDCVWAWRLQKNRTMNALKTGYISPAGEEKAHKFLKQFSKMLEELGIDYNDLHPLLLKPKDNKEEFPEEINTKAKEVLETGDPVQYVANSCNRMALGADSAFKKLISCIAVQNINQSAGLHPKLTGSSSGGKTWTAYTFAHHLPMEAVVKGSMSAKAGFYHKDGNRVFRILDDYQAGNEDLDTVIKQTTSEFHELYFHRTVVKQTGTTLEIGSEQTWAITSVNNDQDIQVLNRSIPINVDDSVDLTRKVNNRTVERYGLGEPPKIVDEPVLVCRCIFQQLRDAGYIDVKIPFWERIEWLDTSNRRNPSIFMDLVIAHTAMFRYQRAKDPNGCYLATEDDFQAAKALFTDKDGEELVKRLTRRERDFLALLVSTPEGLTRADIAERLDIAPQQVSRIFGGRNGDGGLLQKVAIKETQISDMVRISDTHSRTIHKTVYSLRDYDRFAGFDAVVRLNPPQEPSRNKRTHDETIDETIHTKSRGNRETKETIKDKEKEKEKREGCGDVSSHDETPLLHENEPDGFVGFVKEPDNGSNGFVNGSPVVSKDDEETILEDLAPKDVALLERIRGRLVDMGKEVTPFALSIAMSGNDRAIGLERCRAWLEAGA